MLLTKKNDVSSATLFNPVSSTMKQVGEYVIDFVFSKTGKQREQKTSPATFSISIITRKHYGIQKCLKFTQVSKDFSKTVNLPVL